MPASGPEAAEDDELSKLILDKPQLMGVESIGVDTVNLRMVARTLPGKQFEVGRRLRVRVVRALRHAGVVTATDASVTAVGDMAHPEAVAEVHRADAHKADAQKTVPAAQEQK